MLAVSSNCKQPVVQCLNDIKQTKINRLSILSTKNIIHDKQFELNSLTFNQV